MPVGSHAGRLLALVCSASLSALCLSAATFADDMPDEVPPFLSKGTGPNLVLTVDDSSSMNRAYREPTEYSGDPNWGSRNSWSAGIRWLASPVANPVYFNPDTTYKPAKDAQGSPMPIDDATGSFLAYPFRGSADCSSHKDNFSGQQYQPVAEDALGSTTGCTGSADRILAGLEADRPYWYEFDGSVRYREVTNDLGDIQYETCTTVTDDCVACDEADPGPLTPDPCFPTKAYVADLDWDAQERCGESPDNDCPASAAENFINWYKYYRTRMLTVKTALSRVLPDLDDAVRVTYQSMETAEFDNDWDNGLSGTTFPNLATRFDTYAANGDELYKWLFDLSPSRGTSLMSAQILAGEFVSRGISLADDISLHRCLVDDPGFDDPAADGANRCGARCRKNFHLLFTDGAWKEGWGGGGGAFGAGATWPKGTGGKEDGSTTNDGTWLQTNWDNTSLELPTDADSLFGDIDYAPRGPYQDTNFGMLADAAFYYWAHDLRKDIENDVPMLLSDPEDVETYSETNFWNPNNNPATWQHLSLFTVSYGLEGIVKLDELDYGEYGSGDPPNSIFNDGFPSCKAAVYEFDDDGDSDTPPAGEIDANCDLAVTNQAYAIPAAAKADDLLHAALNSRGRYFSASEPEELIEDFRNIFDSISAEAKDEASNAPVSITAGNLSDDTRIFQAVSDSGAWSGEIRSLRLSTGTTYTDDHGCHDVARGEFCDTPDNPYQTTKAAAAFETVTDRVVFTLAEGSGQPQPALFEPAVFGALSTDQQNGLTGDDPTQAAATMYINWLRGAQVDGLRERDTPLGDILGSGPLAVGPPRQLFTDGDYAKFKELHKDRDLMVYVGANDGMLHAFDADSNDSALVETFAYVPAAVYDGLADLADIAYGGGDPKKQAFVDGPLSYSDAEIPDEDGDTNDWRSILVGAFGAGAQGVFALDITDPAPPKTEAGAKDVVLWEFTDASGDDNGLDGRDMGYTFGKPAIVRIDDTNNDKMDPTWVVLVANGYENRSTAGEDASHCDDDDTGAPTNCTVSRTGNAVLYVLNLSGEDASRIRARMDTLEGSDDAPATSLGADVSDDCDTKTEETEETPRSNGLGEVSTLDEDGDLIADRAYAGDLFGNLWRFDLKNLNALPVRLFTAENDDGVRQPITTRIAFARHPNGGHMLLFGTGRFLNTADKNDKTVQSFYGIWDRDDYWSSGQFDVPSREDLLQHELIADGIPVTDGTEQVSLGRISTKVPKNKDTLADPRGWMIDLAPVGGDTTTSACVGSERVVSAPQVRQGRVVFVSMIPGGACASGGTSWINAFNAIDGSRLDTTPFDFNLDGSFDKGDLLPDGEGKAVGSSIRVTADNDSGIYAAPSTLGLGGGRLMSIVSDSEGDLIQLEESGAYGWRTWLQLE